MQTDKLATLLRYALWDVSPQSLECTPTEWQELYDEATKHAVQGLLHDAIADLPSYGQCPGCILHRLGTDVKAVEEGWRRHAAVADTQAIAWQKRGVTALEIKGRTTAALYPIPEHRVCGDIDWWMPTQHDWDAALQAVKDNGLAYEYDSDGDVRYRLGGVIVEHHRKGLEAEGPEGTLLLLNKHLLHHAMGAGAGLRQLCDLTLALHGLEYDRDRYMQLLSGSGMSRWNEVAEELCEYLYSGKKAGRKASKLLSMMEVDGNFGLSKKRRFNGLCRRSFFFLSVAPRPLIRQCLKLLTGRMGRL